MSSIDQNGDGFISFHEFVGLLEAEPHDDDLRDQIREAFRVFDEQDLGYIPAENLTKILTSIGDKLTTGIDANMWGWGIICYIKKYKL